jgi:aminopeptidase N
VCVRHLDLDFNVRFAERRLSGSVTLSIDRVKTEAQTLVLDRRDLAIRNQYAAADPRLEVYLTEIGRRKLIRPLYEALAASPAGRARAHYLPTGPVRVSPDFVRDDR